MSTPSGIQLELLYMFCLDTRNVTPDNPVPIQIDSCLGLGSWHVMKISLRQGGQLESLDPLRHLWDN